ncbi:hypothetical protein DLJ53_23700 [Acuticoccus sediminis]|uniref:Ancillary SecYEG translocon subunit n=1 Tax=Acuticoccus sediminis TaxID=2184697 RepID=A0A8B2NMX1_9HYPH|nr:tetratricopeptide repeat protein [Acuticoccus sediminis]RAH99518.1 hypothetical protein DLJ53_23700 [Acuticoccus sediminis]
MTDIFDELEEDLRRERLARVWNRYGIYVILVAVLIVVVTAGWRGYEWWRVKTERSAGEQYATILTDLDAEGPGAGTQSLEDFAKDAPEGFSILARFRAATTEAANGDETASAATLRDLADDSKVPALYRDLARVRLAQVLINAGDYPAATDAVKSLAEDTSSPFNRSASELMGLAAYAENDLDEAKRWYTQIAESATVSQDMRQRAQTMLSLVERITAQEAATVASDAEAAAQEASGDAAASEAATSPASDDASSATGATAFPMPSAGGAADSGADTSTSGTDGGVSFPMPTGTASDTVGAPAATSPAEPAPTDTVPEAAAPSEAAPEADAPAGNATEADAPADTASDAETPADAATEDTN